MSDMQAFDNPLELDLTEEEEGVNVRDLAKMGTKFGKSGLSSGLKMGVGSMQSGLKGFDKVRSEGLSGTLGAAAGGLMAAGLLAGQIARGANTSDEELQELFDAIDDDGSGELDGLEMRQLIESLGVVLTDAEFAETLAEVVSPDETDVTIAVSEVAISFEDFKSWWAKQTDAQGSTSRFAKILRGEELDVDVRNTGEQLLRTTWFDPSRPFKRIWESAVIVILLYIGVTLPYRIAFESVARGNYYYVAVFYELALISDVGVNMRTAYYNDAEAELVTASWPMFKHYIVNKVGWMDIISSFPFQTFKFDDNPNISGNMKLLQMLRLCQVVRIAKVIRAVGALQEAFFKIVNDTLGSLSVSVSVYTMRMTKLITLLVTVAHLCANIWYILGKPGPSIVDDFGVELTDYINMSVVDADDDGWVMRNYPDKTDDKLFLYMNSFYFIMTTMSTVGYGDLLPVRTGEVMFAMFVQVLGTAIFGYVVGLMGTDVSGLDAHESPVNTKIEFMEAIMDKHKIRKEVRLRVRRQLKANLETAQRFMVESLLDEFPRSLRRDVTLSVYRKAATSYEMVAGYPADYIAEAVTLMRPYQMVKSETLYRLGTPADELFFIDDGKVDIMWEDVRIPPKQRMRYLVASIGEACSFSDEGILSGPVDDVPLRNFMAVGQTPGNLFYVNQIDCVKLLHKYPVVNQMSQKMTKSKLNRWQQQAIAALQGTFDDDVAARSLSPSSSPEAPDPYEYEPKGALPMPQFTELGMVKKEETSLRSAASQDGNQEDVSGRPRALSRQSSRDVSRQSSRDSAAADKQAETGSGASNDDLRADIAKMQKQMDVLMERLVLQ